MKTSFPEWGSLPSMLGSCIKLTGWRMRQIELHVCVCVCRLCSGEKREKKEKKNKREEEKKKRNGRESKIEIWREIAGSFKATRNLSRGDIQYRPYPTVFQLQTRYSARYHDTAPQLIKLDSREIAFEFSRFYDG